MDDSYSPNILTVTDDDGTEHVFEELDRIETDTDRYIAPVSYTHLDVYKRQVQRCDRGSR